MLLPVLFWRTELQSIPSGNFITICAASGSGGMEVIMKKLVVVGSRCPQNHPCPSIRVCHIGALKQQGVKAPTVDEDVCTKCGKCVRYCPMGALQLQG